VVRGAAVERSGRGPTGRTGRVGAGTRAGRRWLSAAGFYGLAALFMLPTVFVFYWMVTLSLKPQVEATAYPPLFFRFSLTLAGYREVFTKYPFLLYTWNSLVVALGSTALGLLVGLPAAYSIARWRQQSLALAILVARIIPGISYLIPWYIFFRTLRMVDTFGALILTHLIVGLPIIIWVMIGFFEDVPGDLEDAALIDGCSYLAAFWRIALPLVKPGVMATSILAFVFSWNNFLFSVILAGRQTRTLPIAVFNMISYEEINWGTLAAAATLITLPVLLVALLAQRHIVTGLTFGAVKQ
jgi:multiple sugar transport system permease protein